MCSVVISVSLGLYVLVGDVGDDLGEVFVVWLGVEVRVKVEVAVRG